MNERLLTARELGEHLGFAPGTIVEWAEAGKIPAFKSADGFASAPPKSKAGSRTAAS